MPLRYVAAQLFPIHGPTNFGVSLAYKTPANTTERASVMPTINTSFVRMYVCACAADAFDAFKLHVYKIHRKHRCE